jgi:hypothetical protein
MRRAAKVEEIRVLLQGVESESVQKFHKLSIRIVRPFIFHFPIPVKL